LGAGPLVVYPNTHRRVPLAGRDNRLVAVLAIFLSLTAFSRNVNSLPAYPAARQNI